MLVRTAVQFAKITPINTGHSLVTPKTTQGEINVRLLQLILTYPLERVVIRYVVYGELSPEGSICGFSNVLLHKHLMCFVFYYISHKLVVFNM